MRRRHMYADRYIRKDELARAKNQIEIAGRMAKSENLRKGHPVRILLPECREYVESAEGNRPTLKLDKLSKFAQRVEDKMAKNLVKYESAAILTLKDAADYNPRGRRDIAKWLRKQADALEKYGAEYAKTTRARYLYREDGACQK